MGTAFLYGNGGSGGTGATLAVTAPAGCTVTISKDGKAKTKTAGADGLAVFQGLATGEWTLTITDGSQTASKVVTVTADYATSITFFAATINITYPAGSTCTATDGITTMYAPDTSGVWACVVPNAGTWTVANDKNGLSDTVIVSENAQSIDVDIAKLYLYRSGNEFTGVTGGWVSKRNCNLTKNNDNLYALATTKYDAYRGLFSPANKIDLTSFTKINYHVKSCNTDSYCGIVLLSSIPESGVDPMGNDLAHVSFDANMAITSSIDISKLSGECYVCGFVTKGSSDTGYITVYQIDLE